MLFLCTLKPSHLLKQSVHFLLYWQEVLWIPLTESIIFLFRFQYNFVNLPQHFFIPAFNSNVLGISKSKDFRFLMNAFGQ